MRVSKAPDILEESSTGMVCGQARDPGSNVFGSQPDEWLRAPLDGHHVCH